jgi:hypothetical protein
MPLNLGTPRPSPAWQVRRRAPAVARLLLLLAFLGGCAAPAPRPEPRESSVPAWLRGVRLWLEPVEELAPPAADRPGRRLGARLALRGRLERPGRSGPWPSEPLRLLLAVEPDRPVDWSLAAGERWIRQHDSPRGIHFGAGRHVEVELELGSDGSFHASLPARLLARRVGQPGLHRLVLASDAGQGRFRPLAASAQGLLLPAASRAGPELEAIAAVTPPDQGPYDPLALVRALNRLRALGEAQALASLENYLSRLGHEPLWPPIEPRPGLFETGSPGAIWLIVPHLFEPRPGAPACPPYSLGNLEPRPQPPLQSWPDYPLVWVDGWPFLCGAFAAQPSSPDSDPERALEWARQHGRLRRLPVTPRGDPLTALAELEARSGLPAGNRPRLQLYRALAPALALPLDALRSAGSDFETGPAWGALEQRLRGSYLRFDPASQSFAIGPP